jgi:hypothetical protein
MIKRERGFYWVDWGALADPDAAQRLPAPRGGAFSACRHSSISRDLTHVHYCAIFF